MALITDQTAPAAGRGWRARLAELARGDSMLMHRLAGAAFLIRVASAVVVYGSQVLLARWMGSYEFGIYVYVWTWVLLLGQAIDMGLAQMAQRFVPEYIERKAHDLLRGFLSGSRWFALIAASCIAATGAFMVYMVEPWLNHYTVIPLYLACIALPAYALANTQDGIARSYDLIGLALAPTFLARQLTITILTAIIHASGIAVDATSVIVISAIAIWGTALAQTFLLNRRLRTRVDPGAKTYDFRIWLAASLPVMMAESFYLLLAYTDILVLQKFVPPDQVAIYYAAAKTLALVSFFYWSVSAAAAHRFSEYHFAGQRDRLSAFLRQTILWTFWPSLAATIFLLMVGRPVLELFGNGFADGYPLMVILAVGLMARAAVGPIEKLLNMLGEQRICALVYATAFAANIGLCLILIPIYGPAGAAVATSTAIIVESILLFFVTRKRLGLHVFVLGKGR